MQEHYNNLKPGRRLCAQPQWRTVAGGSLCVVGLLYGLGGPLGPANPPARPQQTARSEAAPVMPSPAPPAPTAVTVPPEPPVLQPEPEEVSPPAPLDIVESGTPIAHKEDLQALFLKAGVLDPVARKAILAVSEQEGGFDAVNTVDKGYFSVGCIQFTTGREGSGYKLVDVLLRMKADEAARCRRHTKRRNEFDAFFRARGIDVRDGRLRVADPVTGEERISADAVATLRGSRTLVNAFRWAGLHSRAFQIAQLEEAYQAFYLADQSFRIPVVEVRPAADAAGTGKPPAPQYFYGPDAARRAERWTANRARAGATAEDSAPPAVVSTRPDVAGRYEEVFTSEAGKVALMDRAVQHGVSGARKDIDAHMADLLEGGPPELRQLRLRQTDLVARVINRIAVLNNPRFAQPWTPEPARPARPRTVDTEQIVAGTP